MFLSYNHIAQLYINKLKFLNFKKIVRGVYNKKNTIICMVAYFSQQATMCLIKKNKLLNCNLTKFTFIVQLNTRRSTF